MEEEDGGGGGCRRMEEERSGEGVWRGMNRGLVGFCAFSPRVSRVDLGSRFESAAPGIRHLAFAPGICIPLQMSPLVAIYMFTFVMGRSGARNEETGGSQEGCHATLCVAMPRCNATPCVVVRWYRPWWVVKKISAARLCVGKNSRPAGARPRRKFRGLSTLSTPPLVFSGNCKSNSGSRATLVTLAHECSRESHSCFV